MEKKFHGDDHKLILLGTSTHEMILFFKKVFSHIN